MISTLQNYEVVGLPGSPYSLKLRGLMRYRRIPHIWTMLLPELSSRKFSVRPLLLPILRFPDGEERIDSTPLALELEQRHPDNRSVVPTEPLSRFLCLLLEDFADEWLTKAMFHYRWNYEEDVRYCSAWVASDIAPQATKAVRQAIAAELTKRQVARLEIVGCSGGNIPIIEGTFKSLIDILSSHLDESPFLLGSRPSLADFAFYGQLSQLAIDPVPARLMRSDAQVLYDWTRRMDDLSGLALLEWDEEPLAKTGVVELVELVAKIYLPYLIANAAAVDAGEDRFALSYNGAPYAQASFRYQHRCLGDLRRHYAELIAGREVEQLLPSDVRRAFDAE